MHDHHRTDQSMKPTRASHIAIVGSPEDLQTRVHTFHRRPTLVQPLELLGRARDRREAAQVQFTRYTRRQTPVPAGVAALVTGTLPVLVPCRAAVLHGTPILLITDIRHPVTHRRVAHRIV